MSLWAYLQPLSEGRALIKSKTKRADDIGSFCFGIIWELVDQVGGELDVDVVADGVGYGAELFCLGGQALEFGLIEAGYFAVYFDYHVAYFWWVECGGGIHIELVGGVACLGEHA